MVPEIDWTAAEGVTEMLYWLNNHFYSCFDPTLHILPLAQAQAVACLKAIYHCSIERSEYISLEVLSDGDVYSRYNWHFLHLASDQTYLAICCMVDRPSELDMRSLSLSDKMWMACMFTYRLDEGNKYIGFDTFLIDFIDTCLNSESPGRLLADCLLLSGMLLGLQIDRQHLAKGGCSDW